MKLTLLVSLFIGMLSVHAQQLDKKTCVSQFLGENYQRMLDTNPNEIERLEYYAENKIETKSVSLSKYNKAYPFPIIYYKNPINHQVELCSLDLFITLLNSEEFNPLLFIFPRSEEDMTYQLNNNEILIIYSDKNLQTN